jgi:hypothetical protein
MGLGRTWQACALASIVYVHVGAFQLLGPELASGLRAGQLGAARAGSMCSHSPLVPILRQTSGRFFKATASRDNEVEDDRVVRAKTLIQRVESAPRRRSGEPRVTEPSGGGATGDGAGGDGAGGGEGGRKSATIESFIFKGVVVAVTGNFKKMRPEVEERIKSQAATFSGTVGGHLSRWASCCETTATRVCAGVVGCIFLATPDEG